VDVTSREGIANAAHCGGENVRPGSPTSSRSVTFGVLDCNTSTGGVRQKRYKRQSVSIGDSIHEQVGHEDLTPVEAGSSEMSASSASTSTSTSSENHHHHHHAGTNTGPGGGVVVSSSEAALPCCCPFPQLDEALGLPPFSEDTHRSASELHYHRQRFLNRDASANSGGENSSGLDKKRSLSMNDSHCGGGGGGSSKGQSEVSPGGGVKSAARGDEYDGNNLSCLTP
jgi:hypothetical protein